MNPHSSRNERTFDPAQAAKLDDPERLLWLPPADVVAALDLRPGLDVADVGAGNGYFAIPIARAVASGRVFAVDFEPRMLEILRSRLVAAGASNVATIEGSAHATSLREASCDLVFLANLWHELDDHERALSECARILRPGGGIGILDWRPDVSRPPGPPLEHRIAPETVASLLLAAGWRPPRVTSIGSYHYLVVASAGSS